MSSLNSRDVRLSCRARQGRATTERMVGAPSPAYLFVLGWDLSAQRGVDQAVLNLFEQFREDSAFTPIVHVPNWDRQTPEVEDVEGRRTYRIRLLSPWPSGRWLQPIWFALRLPATLLALRRLVKRERVKVINVHYPGLSALNYTIARRLGLIDAKIILTFHNSDIHAASTAPPFARRLYRVLLRGADAIVANSEGLRRRIVAEFPEFDNKSRVIHYGVDIEGFHVETSRAARPSLPARCVLSTGILDWRKGHDILLKSFARCAAAHPEVSLVLLGPPGDASDWIERTIRELGLEHRVLLPGGVPHGMVGRYLEQAEIFVLASRREGLPVAILEAGIFRKPVIASAVDGVPEMIADRETGLLVAADDIEGLAKRLDFLLINPEVARGLGDALHKRIAEDFTRRKSYEEYLAISRSEE